VRRVALAATIGALIPALVGFTWPGTIEWLCTRGIKQYAAGEFDAAGESFERAIEHDPLSHTLQFNRGAALYRQGRYDEAAGDFALAGKTGDQELARDAMYNLGNTHFKASDLKSAIEAYKEALRLDPNDAEAKHNLELALQKQQEQEQQDQQQEDQQQEQDDEQQEDEDQQQDDQQQEEEDEQQQDQQEQQQDDEQEQDEQQSSEGDEQSPSPADQRDEGELSEAQARRLLHALASQDAEMQKLIRRVPQRRQPREGEKDW